MKESTVFSKEEVSNLWKKKEETQIVSYASGFLVGRYNKNSYILQKSTKHDGFDGFTITNELADILKNIIALNQDTDNYKLLGIVCRPIFSIVNSKLGCRMKRSGYRSFILKKSIDGQWVSEGNNLYSVFKNSVEYDKQVMDLCLQDVMTSKCLFFRSKDASFVINNNCSYTDKHESILILEPNSQFMIYDQLIESLCSDQAVANYNIGRDKEYLFSNYIPDEYVYFTLGHDIHPESHPADGIIGHHDYIGEDANQNDTFLSSPDSSNKFLIIDYDHLFWF